MWLDSYFGTYSPLRDVFNTPALRAQAYDFCNWPGFNSTCTFVTFTLFDTAANNWAVSDYYYQVEKGACQNSFVGTREEW
jgi:hypothetical protein